MKRHTLLAAVLSLSLAAGAQPWRDASLTFEQRADDLLSRLTLQEKVSLMVDGTPAIERLGIPPFQWWNEALHGLGRNSFATVFPITMELAATWDNALVERIYTAVSDEARAKNNQAKRRGEIKRYQGLSFWTPNINIYRDPRWGRGQETYGEDPCLTATMGLAVVRGLQGPEDTKYRKLYACAKHFAVHSGPEWNRHTFNLDNVSPRDLWETYLPAFKSLVQQGGVREVMCAYQRLDGVPCCGNNRLLNQILRDEWGFRHLVVSDCGAINDFMPDRHGYAKDPTEAGAKAVIGGTDVECGSNYKKLPAAVKRGDIDEERINRSVRRLLIGRFELGDFDPDSLVCWTKIKDDVVASPAHKALALEAAQKGTVLLQNRGGLLPLDKAERIAVMGPNATDIIMLRGNYNGFPTSEVSIYDGIAAVSAARPILLGGCELTRSEVRNSRFTSLRTPDGQQGMAATYWNNLDMQGTPCATDVLAAPLNLSNGGATVFAPGVNLTDFSARYEATYTPQQDETLTFDIVADDTATVYVDDQEVIRSVVGGHHLSFKKKEYAFKGGQTYRIRLDFKQKDNMASVAFDLYTRTVPTPAETLAALEGVNTVVFAGGISPRIEGEEMKVSEPGFKGGDRTNIDLPEPQRNILKLLHDADKRIVFVNCSGGAMALEREAEYCDAVIQAWYGGEAGGTAVADVLYGNVNPSGKLPVTFYKKSSDLPDFLDYSMKNRTYRYFTGEPQWPFGYGMSYTTFQFSKPTYKKGVVSLTVSNTGQRDGDEVVQVYVKRNDDADGPQRALRAFQRVSLKAGETKTVSIPLPADAFEWWDNATNTMRVQKGRFTIYTGNSSATRDLQAITIKN